MPMVHIKNLHKKFTLHAQNGAVLNVLNGIDLQVKSGEIAALCGPSGAGKSSLLKAIYGTYRINSGDIKIKTAKQNINIAKAAPRDIMLLRRDVIGYVSQFLRVIPRIGALGIVAEPAIMQGMPADQAHKIALDLLDQLRIPQKLHNLSPLTFSGGEQQRVNIARAMAAPRPLMLFDEPTASLDPQNRQTVLQLIAQLRDQGTAILGIFHDPADRKFLNARDIQLSAIEEAEHV